MRVTWNHMVGIVGSCFLLLLVFAGAVMSSSNRRGRVLTYWKQLNGQKVEEMTQIRRGRHANMVASLEHSAF